MSRGALVLAAMTLSAACLGCAREEREAPAPPGGPPPAGTATGLAGWSLESGADGERFLLRFHDGEGVPARPSGPIAARVMRELGVLRLRLPAGIRSTEVTDSIFDGAFVTRAFVVRPLDGEGLFVDVHAATPIEASMAASAAPNEWAVLVRRGGGPWPTPPACDRRVVVLAPRPDARFDSLVVISGYARVFESTVSIRIEEGDATRDTFTTAADWAETWGEFLLSLPAPRTPATLFVGEHSAEDGSFQGIPIPVGRPVRVDD